MAKRKKRKIKVGRLLLLVIILIAIVVSIAFLLNLITAPKQEKLNIDDLKINELDYSQSTSLDINLNSNAYELIRLNDFKVLYAKNNDTKIFPASLTKVLTMDAVLSICDDISDTSSFTYEQREDLIAEDASLAYIVAGEEYSIEDLLFALVLPSGADAATALDNYAINKTGKSLVELMNEKVKELGLKNSHFTNTTGLHDDDLYTTLDDYSKIVIDCLLNTQAKKVLKTEDVIIEGGNHFYSTLEELFRKCEGMSEVTIYGGKTGFTLEAGMNLMVLFEANNRSYLLILADAPGNPYRYAAHIEDAYNIINNLYYN